jgi:hypothetical protein
MVASASASAGVNGPTTRSVGGADAGDSVVAGDAAGMPSREHAPSVRIATATTLMMFRMADMHVSSFNMGVCQNGTAIDLAHAATGDDDPRSGPPTMQQSPTKICTVENMCTLRIAASDMSSWSRRSRLVTRPFAGPTYLLSL